MRKARAIVCLMILILTIPTAYHLRRQLPPDTMPMIEKKYGGWAGVLRLWVCDDPSPGSDSLAAWLNRCISAYDKRHPGVYIQPEYVDSTALTADGLMPPDLALFPPGAIDDDRLIPLDIRPALRPGLLWDDRAVPVLMGCTVWAYNTARLDDIPRSWRDAGVSPAAAPDQAAPLLALCSSRYSENTASEAPRGEIELGLFEDNSENAPTPAPSEGGLSCRLPQGFRFTDDAWRQFINGEAAATPVTPREIRMLSNLSAQGKGPDWRLALTGQAMFTDRLLYIGAFDQDSDEKLTLCREFAAHLLTDACQQALHRVGAFAVTGASSGYPVGDALGRVEQMMSGLPVIAPAPFDDDWQTDADEIVRKFIDDDGDPAALIGVLSERFRQKTEHSD